jgi:hypothetical protein
MYKIVYVFCIISILCMNMTATLFILQNTHATFAYLAKLSSNAIHLGLILKVDLNVEIAGILRGLAHGEAAGEEFAFLGEYSLRQMEAALFPVSGTRVGASLEEGRVVGEGRVEINE